MTNADWVRSLDDRQLCDFFNSLEKRVTPWAADRIAQCRKCKKIKCERTIKITGEGEKQVTVELDPCALGECPHGNMIEVWLRKEAVK